MFFVVSIFLFLFSVLKTFLHDPLVEWSKQGKGLSKAPANETGEILNEKVCDLLDFELVFSEYPKRATCLFTLT